MVKKGGERFFAQLESRVGQEPGDQLWLVVSDISSLKRAEESAARHAALAAAHAELEIEKNRYQDLFDFAPDSYLVTDETGVILEINQAGAALLCSAKESLVGALLVNFMLEGEKANFQNRFNDNLEKKTADITTRFGEWEVYLNPMGREPFPAAVTAMLLQEKPDKPIQIRWLFRDVSARKQTEAELGKNMARFRALFEESSLGIRLLDLQGSTITCNAVMQEILGYTEDELRQIPFTQLTEPLDQVEDEGSFHSVVSGEIDRYTIEKRCICKDGKLVWVHQVVFLVRDAANAPAFLVAMTENISERKQMESELTEVRRHLINMPEAERLMLSQELHDGPMQDLYGVFYNIKSLEAKLSGEDAEIVTSNATTINQVVHVLSGFAGQLRPPTLKSSGLEKTIRSHAEQFQEDHPEINLTLDLMPDGNKLPERVSLALFRIYQQSLANILRHAHATSVNICLFIDEQHLQLRIEDNGNGFEVPSRLVDLVRKGHYGLLGSAERAEAIGGALTIDSKHGMGTTIFVNMNLK
jgi:PAS domain S-box-containing protein